MDIGKRIKQRRKELGISAEYIAEKIGVNPATVYRYESADIMNIGIDKIELLAAALRTTPAYIMGWEEEENIIPAPSTRKIPLLGKIACGTPITAIEHPEEYVDVPEFVKADFALLCQGDSMINARILDGDIVYIRRQASVENGEIAAVLVDGEATLKRVFYSAGAVTLIAENPAFPPLVFAGSAAAELQILGKATYFVSKAR